MLPAVDRSPDELNDALVRRMEDFASDLFLLTGMTKRGAVLPEDYRSRVLPPIRDMTVRVLDALLAGEVIRHPWDHERKSDAA